MDFGCTGLRCGSGYRVIRVLGNNLSSLPPLRGHEQPLEAKCVRVLGFGSRVSGMVAGIPDLGSRGSGLVPGKVSGMAPGVWVSGNNLGSFFLLRGHEQPLQVGRLELLGLRAVLPLRNRDRLVPPARFGYQISDIRFRVWDFGYEISGSRVSGIGFRFPRTVLPLEGRKCVF